MQRREFMNRGAAAALLPILGTAGLAQATVTNKPSRFVGRLGEPLPSFPARGARRVPLRR